MHDGRFLQEHESPVITNPADADPETQCLQCLKTHPRFSFRCSAILFGQNPRESVIPWETDFSFAQQSCGSKELTTQLENVGRETLNGELGAGAPYSTLFLPPSPPLSMSSGVA